MKRTRRVIQDDFPIRDLDRDELTRAFAELRQKRLARERRAGNSVASDSAGGSFARPLRPERAA
jgi:hypothetical protein